MKIAIKFLAVILPLFATALACAARDAAREQFLNVLFKGRDYPVTLSQSSTYPWYADYNKVKTTSRQKDVQSNCWFALDVYVPEDSATVSFDYQVRYHKEEYGWAKYATLTCSVDGTAVFSNNGNDKVETATVRVGKGFHQLKWNLRLGEAWENWDYFASIENMRIEGISAESALPEFSQTISRLWAFPLEAQLDTIAIENLGKQDFRISSIDGLTAPYSIKSAPETVAPGMTDHIIVAYEPQEEGCHEQTMTLISNLGKQTLPLHGMAYETVPVCNPAPGKLAEAAKDYGVESLALFGPMSRADNYTLNKFKNLKYLDLRGTDMEYIFNGGVNNLYKLEDILLPSSLKYIDATWFWKHWDSDRRTDVYYNIRTITCLSPEPPRLVYYGGGNGEYAFDGLKSDVIVYVPVQYLPFYEADPKWNRFKIMPIMDDSKSLRVSLNPATLADYAGCSVELQDHLMQRTQRLTVGKSGDYVFHNLKPGRQYTLNLLHPSGRILASKESVAVGENRETVVQFEAVVSLYKVALKVTGVEEVSLTDRVQASWTTPYENRQSGTEVRRLFEGDTVKCQVALPGELGREYVTPDTMQYIVKASDNNLHIELAPHTRYVVKGTVLDRNNKPVPLATVAASQILNGNLPWNKMAKTDSAGRFELSVYEGEIAFNVSANRYFSVQRTDTITCDTDWGNLQLSPCSGRNIVLEVMYQENATADKEGYVSSGYSDWKDLVFAVTDSETGRGIEQVKVEYPHIYILEELSETPALTVKVSSRNKAFRDIEAGCSNTSDGNFFAAVRIVGYGDVRASYREAMTEDVLALVYDEAGNLFKSSAFVNNRATFKALPDGQYRIVAMESNSLYENVPGLQGLEKLGLIEGKDYCSATLDVVSGMVHEAVFGDIPVLSEPHRIASDKSYIAPVKNTVVAGNYLTVKSSVELKPDYYGKTEHLSLNIQIPDSCTFVPNSLLIGSELAPYSVEGRTVEVPLQENSETVRFCILPMKGGRANVSAYISYDLEGIRYHEPIGGFEADVTGVSLNVLPTVPSHTICVSGSGTAHSAVEVIDDGTVVGRTSVLANGMWQTTIELCGDRDLKTHQLYSRLTTPDSIRLYSETKKVKVNSRIPYVKRIEMINGTPREYVTVFDFDNPFAPKPSYSYSSSYPDFTFKVWFGHVDDPMDINDAVLWVRTTDGKDVPLQLIASPADSTLMIATGRFHSSYSLPQNVTVVTNYIDDSYMEPDHIINLLDECMPSATMVDILKDGNAVSYALVSDHGDFELLCGGVEYEEGDAISGTIERIVSRFNFAPALGSDAFLFSPEEGALYLKKEEGGKTLAFFLYETYAAEEYYAVMSMLSENLVKPVLSRIHINADGYLEADPGNRLDAAMQELIDNCNRRLDCVDVIGDVNKDYAAEDLRETLNNIRHLNVAMATNLLCSTYSIASGAPRGQNAVQDAWGIHSAIGATRDMVTATEGISQSLRLHIRNLQRYPADCNLPHKPDYVGTGVTPLIDPSGYVYEAVESNRLEGVKTTAYFKTEITDTKGNVKDSITVWDASMYGQENPLYTDVEGRYAWDVPAGMWQVKYEKEGYETTTSDWLPVPPPQMDVNVGMTQLVNPTVVSASAYPEAVNLSFSKYMDVRSLTTANITVKKDDVPIDGQLVLADAETAGGRTFASVVRFEPATPLNTGEKVVLSVSYKVRSYAGCQLDGDYMAMLTVNQPVSIDMTDTVDVELGTTVPVAIGITPGEAAAGHTLTLSMSGESVASVDKQVLDAGVEGQPLIVNIAGLLPGTTVLTAEIEDLGVKASSEIRVANNLMKQTYAPWATIESGSSVEMGTKVYLFCATPKATIYYTTDGSCPCDAQTRNLYDPDEGITIEGDMTIRALAVAEGMHESESIELNYTIRELVGKGNLSVQNSIVVTPTYLSAGNNKVAVCFGANAGYATVEVFDMRGSKMVKKRVFDGDTLSFAGLPGGTYVVSVCVSGRRMATKVTKSF